MGLRRGGPRSADVKGGGVSQNIFSLVYLNLVEIDERIKISNVFCKKSYDHVYYYLCILILDDYLITYTYVDFSIYIYIYLGTFLEAKK